MNSRNLSVAISSAHCCRRSCTLTIQNTRHTHHPSHPPAPVLCSALTAVAWAFARWVVCVLWSRVPQRSGSADSPRP